MDRTTLERRLKKDTKIEFWLGLSIVALLILGVCGWITHVGWFIVQVSSEVGATISQIALGVIGVFIPPFGIIHGWMLWAGIV